jgi:DNA-binding transcriptional ArsR family regulator
MESNIAVQRLSALAHESRLAVFRYLVRQGPEGTPAGEIARALKIAPNTLSAHLNLLTNAGLTQSRRAGRSIIYSTHYEGMSELMLYLAEDCCDSRAEICAPIATAIHNVGRCEAVT